MPETPIVRTKRRRKITLETCYEIAQFVAKGLTESEACSLLDIKPETWYDWKCDRRHDPRYAEALTRVRAEFVRDRLATIKQAENKDWRAAQALLAMTLPERFSNNRQTASTVQVAVMSNDILAALGKSFEGRIQPQQSPCQLPNKSPKSLPDSTLGESTTSDKVIDV